MVQHGKPSIWITFRYPAQSIPQVQKCHWRWLIYAKPYLENCQWNFIQTSLMTFELRPLNFGWIISTCELPHPIVEGIKFILKNIYLMPKFFWTNIWDYNGDRNSPHLCKSSYGSSKNYNVQKKTLQNMRTFFFNVTKRNGKHTPTSSSFYKMKAKRNTNFCAIRIEWYIPWQELPIVLNW